MGNGGTGTHSSWAFELGLRVLVLADEGCHGFAAAKERIDVRARVREEEDFGEKSGKRSYGD